MIQRDRHSIYKGLRITVRWMQGESPVSHARHYTSSYLIGDPRTDHSEWHDLTDPVFHTYDTAAAYCLAQAKRDIDAMTAGRP